MLNESRLHEVLAQYKSDFLSDWWKKERYKWEAVKTFQDNWDVNATDFADMLSQSLSNASNLLISRSYYPAAMIGGFAKSFPEEVRAMFIALFDESVDVVERISAFKDQSAVMHAKNKANGSNARNHFQDEHAISTYLWLRYPDKYYIYKYREVKRVAEALGSERQFKSGDYAKNLRNFYDLYDEICEYISADTELTSLFQSHLTDVCYPDPAYKTLTADVGFYIKQRLAKDEDESNVEDEPSVDDKPKSDLQPDVNPLPVEQSSDKYAKEDFLREVFMSEQAYDTLAGVLKSKKNLILQGAPGVGKTFAAKRLAYSVMGEKDESRVEFVQFHQNYSYEDFMMGYRPSEDGFELKTGIFYRFCQKAANRPERDFFFIIDEINRGNMSKIFGELLMLIENDYRGTKTTLAYNGLSFSVPENLYIIGMMNTADRSLAMIDYALRRRFSFFEMKPAFDSEGFVLYQNKLNDETFNQIIEKIKELNKEIIADPSLGKGFCIGHSYFSNWSECTEEKMRAVVDFDILPMLDEYWFDDPAKQQRWSNILHGIFQ